MSSTTFRPSAGARISHAFDVKPGDRMYLAPQDRVVFW
jgi:predicted metalloendopeptidase